MTGWTGAAGQSLDAFADAAASFTDLVARVGPERWSDPGLGGWDVRSLVGHGSRSLVTVITYLDRPADTEDVASAADYVALSTKIVLAAGDAVEQRGRQAGLDLGADPAAAVAALAQQALARLRASDPDDLLTTLAGGMRVAQYLPTRTFELVVHGYDLIDALGLTGVGFDPVALSVALGVATDVAVAADRGPDVLRTLTGRAPWPENFSVVR